MDDEIYEEVMADFQELIKLSSHYAKLLNDYDGGNRMTFSSVDEWIERLAHVRRERERDRWTPSKTD